MLLLECKPDEELARRLGRIRRDCLHLNDKGRVCNWLKRKEGLVAMIDEDPGAAQPPYLKELKRVSDEHGIRVLCDESRGHRVVILQPRLEEWVIETARTANIAMEGFGLSERGNELHREINSRLPGFAKLVDRLLDVQSPRMACLQRLIRE
jgi:hypothetical protein